MHIHHVAIWAQDLEAFYCTLFGRQGNECDPTKQFSSCFVRFEGAPAWS